MKEKLVNYMRAGYPAIAIRTVEEPRAVEVILDAAKDRDRNVFTWSAFAGIEQVATSNEFLPAADDEEEAKTPAGCAEAFLGALAGNDPTRKPGVLVMLDFHSWVKDLTPYAERVIKELLMVAENHGLLVIFLGITFDIPESFSRYVTVFDFELPDREQLGALLDVVRESAASSGINLEALENGHREEVIRAMTGLTAPEAKNALALAIVEAAGEDPEAPRRIDPKTIYREKAAAVKRSGTMEIIEPDARGLDAIGGLDLLKEYILTRRNVYTKKAREYGLPNLKGMLVTSPPGCGKSLAAKCVGTVLNVPTLRLDIGSLMGGIVGQTEANTRAALATADAIAPCVVWIDEVEKGLAGTKGSGDLDSGVGKRMLATILTWQQEHKSDVYLFATANDPWLLPAPFIRKGRFDEMFAIDLPVACEREEIAAIHLKAVGRDLKKFDLKKISTATDLFTGAEIEGVIRDAMFAAFYDDAREVKTKDVLAAAKATVPCAKTMKEEVKMIREFGDTRCRPASTVTKDKGEQFTRLMEL